MKEIIFHTEVLTQTQLVAFLDLLKEFGLLIISDDQISDYIGILDRDKHCFKPIKSHIPQLRRRTKPEISMINLTDKNVNDIYLNKYDKTTFNQFKLREEFEVVFNRLKLLKGADNRIIQ